MTLCLLSTEAPAPPDLGERVRRRDRGAWDRLVADEHARLFNLHLRLTGDREAAADLTQDTFVEAWRSADGFTGRGSPRAWLYGVALNVNRGWRRRQGRREAPEEVGEDAPDSGPTADEIAILRERTELVLDAVRRLPETYRRTVALRYFAGLSAPEIAAVEGIDPGTVRWRLHEANKRLWALLRPRLGEEGDDGAGQAGQLRIAP
ncbi:MAG: RNA polymerase sigma factor [Armatimonadota bacterium]